MANELIPTGNRPNWFNLYFIRFRKTGMGNGDIGVHLWSWFICLFLNWILNKWFPLKKKSNFWNGVLNFLFIYSIKKVQKRRPSSCGMKRWYLNSIKNRDEVLFLPSFKLGNGERKTRICPVNMPNELKSPIDYKLSMLGIKTLNDQLSSSLINAYSGGIMKWGFLFRPPQYIFELKNALRKLSSEYVKI